jgi:multidrug efflux pump subunit AcrA (membrane-fusion protein)
MHMRALVFLAAAAVTLAGLAAGCNRPPANAPAPGAPAAAESSVPRVTTVKPERKTIQHTVSQPGHIQAYEQTPVYSKIAGYVGKWNRDMGARVSEGEVLAELWVPEMVVDVAQKKALVGQAEAEVKQAREAVAVAEGDLKSAEAKVQVAEAKRLRAQAQLRRAQSQYERLAKAGREGAITKEDVEESRLGLEASRAGLEEVKAQILSARADRDANRAKRDKARVDVTVFDARLEVAKKNVDQARALLDYSHITAPFAGVVTQRNIDKGHFVQPVAGAKGDALFVVARTGTMRVRVEVPEAEADWVGKGSPVRLRVPALKEYQFSGKVARTSWSLDRTARTLLAEIDVPNDDGRLRPGMYAHATIEAERPGVWTLPVSAIVTEGDVTQGYKTFCFLVKKGKAWRTPLQVGARDSERVEILKKQTRPDNPKEEGKWENITGEEVVVRSNASGLKDGQAVNVSP